MSEAIEPAVQAIAGGCCEHQRQVAGLSRLDKTPLQRLDDFVGCADAYKSGRGDRIA